MALREFTDDAGAGWRAWDITPQVAHPATRLEDYLQGFADGWLVFERMDGAEKRRICPVPVGWDTLGDGELCALCDAALGVRAMCAPVAQHHAAPNGPHDADPTEVRATGRSRATSEDPHTRRSFSYPGGRVWSAGVERVQYRDEHGANIGDPAEVLRFVSGSRTLDLFAWPLDWWQYSDEELAKLLCRAFPRDRSRASQTERRRRHSDSEQLSAGG